MKVHLKQALSKLYYYFRYYFFPYFCSYCYRYTDQPDPLCSHCIALITPIASLSLKITRSHHLIVHAISDYQNPLRALILSKSYSNRVAAQSLGVLASAHIHRIACHYDYIVPIPLYWQRYARRGYNQAYEMAKIISRVSNKPLVELVTRHKNTRFQTQCTPEMRKKNVHDAFTLNLPSQKNDYYGKSFLIVDDLMTTGATLHAVAHQLLILNPLHLTAVVACRVI